MANNLIQIKRSINTAVPTSLATGELAFTANGDHLYIGSPNGSIIPIGGFFNYGVLTANQALVANSTGFVNEVKTRTLTTTSIVANSTSTPGAGYLLSVDGGGNTYWLAQGAVSINVDSQYTWTNTHTFNANVITNDSLTANIFSVDGTLSANSTQLTVQKNAFFNANVAFGQDANDVVSFVSTIDSDIIPTNNAIHTIGNSSFNWAGIYSTNLDIGSAAVTANSSQLTLANTVGVSANGSVGTDGQVLTSNGTTVYWTTPSDTLINSVTAGVGLTGGGTDGDVTVSLLANNGISSNSTGTFVVAANGVSVDNSGVNVVVTNGLLSNTSGVHVVTGSTLTVNTTGIHVNSALSITDLSLSGNLTVLGTLTTIDTTNLVVQDSLIQLANGNASDTLDIGIFGTYNEGSTEKYTGIFRDASESGVYKLYSGITTIPTTTVDTADAGYVMGTLQSYLDSGALISNSTSVGITANSSISVSLAANSISWSGLANNGIIYGGIGGAFTSLAAGAGGTILQISTSGVPEFATLDGGTF